MAALTQDPFTPETSKEGYSCLLLSMSLIHQMLYPLILAACASRICDIENKGNTPKALYTLQSPKSLFFSKLAVNTGYLLFLTLSEAVAIPVMGRFLHITQSLPVKELLLFLLAGFTVNSILYTLQQFLSLLMQNQLIPLFIGLMGTFLGTFTAFFPPTPFNALIPWSYYTLTGCAAVLMSDNEYHYILTPFPLKWFLIILIFGMVYYFIGMNRYLKKEV